MAIFSYIRLALVSYKTGKGRVSSYTFVNIKQGTQWQQCGPRISYRPAPAGNLWYSSLTSSCLALPLSTLCLRISAISIHHSSNLELSRSTSSWRKAIQNTKKKQSHFILFPDTEPCWSLNYTKCWLTWWWQFPTLVSFSVRDPQPGGKSKTEDRH